MSRFSIKDIFETVYHGDLSISPEGVEIKRQSQTNAIYTNSVKATHDGVTLDINGNVGVINNDGITLNGVTLVSAPKTATGDLTRGVPPAGMPRDPRYQNGVMMTKASAECTYGNEYVEGVRVKSIAYGNCAQTYDEYLKSSKKGGFFW